MIFFQQFHRMAETHAACPHHPRDYIAAGVARTQTMPQVLLRTDDQRGRAVVVKRAPPDPVRAMRS
ncbi:MAG TPA: hypothetical protein VN633_00855 [Bryobacteraceae bacterium]|nr:hypothetical protein [Bryobacteraceae bacterium]